MPEVAECPCGPGGTVPSHADFDLRKGEAGDHPSQDGADEDVGWIVDARLHSRPGGSAGHSPGGETERPARRPGERRACQGILGQGRAGESESGMTRRKAEVVGTIRTRTTREALEDENGGAGSREDGDPRAPGTFPWGYEPSTAESEPETGGQEDVARPAGPARAAEQRGIASRPTGKVVIRRGAGETQGGECRYPDEGVVHGRNAPLTPRPRRQGEGENDHPSPLHFLLPWATERLPAIEPLCSHRDSFSTMGGDRKGEDIGIRNSAATMFGRVAPATTDAKTAVMMRAGGREDRRNGGAGTESCFPPEQPPRGSTFGETGRSIATFTPHPLQDVSAMESMQRCGRKFKDTPLAEGGAGQEETVQIPLRPDPP